MRYFVRSIFAWWVQCVRAEPEQYWLNRQHFMGSACYWSLVDNLFPCRKQCRCYMSELLFSHSIQPQYPCRDELTPFYRKLFTMRPENLCRSSFRQIMPENTYKIANCVYVRQFQNNRHCPHKIKHWHSAWMQQPYFPWNVACIICSPFSYSAHQ